MKIAIVCLFEEIFISELTDYKSHQQGSSKYKEAIKCRLGLRNKVYGVLARDYQNKLIVKHFYETSRPVPIWAIFELLSFGEFGVFFSCLNPNTRINISKSISINSAFDPDGKIPQIIIFTLKDLRNAIAHNDTVFDTRFKTGKVNNRLSQLLSVETGITGIDFLTIVDYVILISYVLKLLGISKSECRRIVKDFLEICENLRSNVPIHVSSKIIHTNTRTKMTQLLTYL